MSKIADWNENKWLHQRHQMRERISVSSFPCSLSGVVFLHILFRSIIFSSLFPGQSFIFSLVSGTHDTNYLLFLLLPMSPHVNWSSGWQIVCSSFPRILCDRSIQSRMKTMDTSSGNNANWIQSIFSLYSLSEVDRASGSPGRVTRACRDSISHLETCYLNRDGKN